MQVARRVGEAIVYDCITVVTLIDLQCRWVRTYDSVVIAARSLSHIDISLDTSVLSISPPGQPNTLLRFAFPLPSRLTEEVLLRAGFLPVFGTSDEATTN